MREFTRVAAAAPRAAFLLDRDLMVMSSDAPLCFVGRLWPAAEPGEAGSGRSLDYNVLRRAVGQRAPRLLPP